MSETLAGTPFPSLTLPTSGGGSMTLPDDLAGFWFVLYFYPKDDTPGCTRQACAYRDNIDSFLDNGAKVLGVSADDVDSHDAFTSKYSLNFPLLVDADRALARALGVSSRDTFLVDPNGVIRRVWRAVNPSTTMSETFDALVELRSL